MAIIDTFDLIVSTQPHASHTDCGLFQLRDLICIKPKEIPVLALQDNVLMFRHDFNVKQLVVLTELSGCTSALSHVKLPAAHDLAHALLCDEKKSV